MTTEDEARALSPVEEAWAALAYYESGIRDGVPTGLGPLQFPAPDPSERDAGRRLAHALRTLLASRVSTPPSEDGLDLVTKTVAEIVALWRPGSYEWSWAEEYENVMTHPRTADITARVDAEGIGFQDHIAPVLLGNDGRVWDGHHRICIAIKRGIATLRCEVSESVPAVPVPPREAPEPGCQHEECEINAAGESTRCADCGALLAAPTEPEEADRA